MFYFIWVWSRLNFKSNYIKHINNCYQLVTWEWYLKFSYAWKIISTSKDKIKRELLSLLAYKFKCNSCNAEYIGKTKRHSRTRTSEHIGVSPLKLQPCIIICFFVGQLLVLKIFQFWLKVHVISSLRFRKVFWLNY